MTILHIGVPQTTSLGLTSLSLATEDDDSLRGTTTALAATTISAGISTPDHNICMTHQYLDSLTDEQIVEMMDHLEQKDEFFIEEAIQTADQPKVYQKTDRI